jgi:hypothetical protein
MPEETKIIVFSSGRPKGDTVLKPYGGHILPIHTDGFKL